MLEKVPLVFIIGAGASCAVGIPDIEGFYEEFKTYLRQKKEDHSLVEEQEQRPMAEKPNLETLITGLRDIQSSFGTFSRISTVPEDLKKHAEDAERLHNLLMSFVINSCNRFDQKRAVQYYRPLLEISKVKPIWVFTTNYDRVIEYCCEICDMPFSDGFLKEKTEPFSIWKDLFEESLNIAKIHGSIDWFRDAERHDRIIKLDEPHPFPSSEFRITYRELSLSTSIIIPTFEKYMSEFPFIDLWIKLNDAISQADLCVVVGSKLRDSHLRNLLLKSLDRVPVIAVSRNPESIQLALESHPNVIPVPSTFERFSMAASGYFKELLPSVDSSNALELAKEFAHKVQQTLSNVQLGQVSEGGQVDELFRSLKSQSYAERGNAASMLGNLGVRSAVPKLTEMLDDPEEYARLQAVSALGQLADQESVPKLGEMLLEESSDDVRAEIILVLKTIGGDRAKEILSKAKSLPDLPSYVYLALGN